MTTAVLPSFPVLSPEEKNTYYILTENQPYGCKLFQAGSMCYLNEQTYLRYITSDLSSTRFWRFVMADDGSVVTMDVEILQPLTDTVANFLMAISDPRERLNCFLERRVLDDAMKAKLGEQVVIHLDKETFSGIICYIGKIHRNRLPSGLCPIYFGVELQVRR